MTIGLPELIVVVALLGPIALALFVRQRAPGKLWVAVLLALCGPFGQLYVRDSARAIGLLFALSLLLRVPTAVGMAGWWDITSAVIWIAAAEVLMVFRLRKAAAIAKPVAVCFDTLAVGTVAHDAQQGRHIRAHAV